MNLKTDPLVTMTLHSTHSQRKFVFARLLFALVLIVVTTSCTKPIEKIADLIFDEGQITSKDTYRYECDDAGRITVVYGKL